MPTPGRYLFHLDLWSLSYLGLQSLDLWSISFVSPPWARWSWGARKSNFDLEAYSNRWLDRVSGTPFNPWGDPLEDYG